MPERDPKYYVTGYSGGKASLAPFYRRALIFDGEEGELNSRIIDEFNEYIRAKDRFSVAGLLYDHGSTPEYHPGRIVIINASHDDLPTSYETGRVVEEYFREKRLDIPIKIVNSREELEEATGEVPGSTLILSQCVDKNVYNVEVADELEKKGVVIVPGKKTAPGGVFSDKDSTYQLLSENHANWDRVAKYVKVPVDGRSVPEVVEGIFEALKDLKEQTGDTTFFVKPHEGGGGLGGFRVTRTAEGFVIPDLSKVSGDVSVIRPTYFEIDYENKAKLRELLWIYRLFSGSKEMSDNYLDVKLPLAEGDEDAALEVLKSYLVNSREKRDEKLASMSLDRESAARTLTDAIELFEKKFDRRYTPLVNEHIDFGLWGLRAHYRLSGTGPVLETIYHRVFQLGFTEEGIGYMGSDNISNKQTGALEIARLGPINSIMLESIGGREVLFETLLKGAEALLMLSESITGDDYGHIPLRLQIDLAAVSQRIGEGNADTARGLCIASRWEGFVKHTREWLEDSLRFYSWKKDRSGAD